MGTTTASFALSFILFLCSFVYCVSAYNTAQVKQTNEFLPNLSIWIVLSLRLKDIVKGSR